MDVINDTIFYDVVIIGGGIAGLSSCRHLLLNIPDLCNKRIAIIEPRSAERNNLNEDYKVGESTVEVSAMFFSKELQLQDYLIENHPPKFSLQFHWPKEAEKTDTMDDYYSTWAVKNPDIQAFQLNRCKMERDLLKMVIDQGAVYYHGRVKDIDLTKGDNVKTLSVQILSDTENFYDQKVIDNILIQTDYIVDASGRNFAIGSRTDNVLKDPKHLFGLQNASTWVRVKNVDKKLFDFNNPNVTASWYYATNHFFGHGYWIWMIPLERGSHDFSIGVSYHRDKIDPSQLNSYEKFMNFLEKNQKILYNLISSGELVDFHRWPKLAHTSKVFFSEDNWAVLGDAAAIFDPFYSTGMIMIAFEVECLTELIKMRLQKNWNSYSLKRKTFDKLIRAVTQINNHLIKDHSNHLGNASVMSWRIYIESSNYFGILLPAYIGKYHLCPEFSEKFLQGHEKNLQVRNDILRVFDDIIERGLNIGFMDNHRGGQLLGDWSPTSSWDYDKCLSLCKYEHKRLNLPLCLAWTSFYQSLSFLKIFMTAYGYKSVLNPLFHSTVSHSLWNFSKFYMVSWVHWYKNRSRPVNAYYQDINDNFKSYKASNALVPWKY
ncbi:hypothetical protein DLAC_07521 [Tieghemostelium lacteum]|uniref:Uncharacterized protein n=1 Tax=Tieghemostelium lacteum TaxID=361077 RepID=A0A151ZCQ7_TIELA|nr:hypothetical protein DLAC_07521 [Tieghemostelium lacteum]|eukprot:KYQ91737.1 hypothetical protein DLAC_07521 [Tieghemostelium lacteum]